MTPILGDGTDQILAAAAEHKWTVIDMAADWATVQPPGLLAQRRERYRRRRRRARSRGRAAK